MLKQAKRCENIKSFIVMEILEKALKLESQGIDVVHMEVGEPDFATPEPITKICIESLQQGETHYSHSLGIYDLRQAISRHYMNEYGVVVDPEQVIVTPGSSPAIFLTCSAILNPGDEVILANPYYSCYPNFINYMGAKPVFVNVFEEDGFQLTAEKIKNAVTHKTKAIIINSPANPTGFLLGRETMQELASLGITIFSDEIYHGLVYEGKANSILEFTQNAVVFNGFSKLFAMTGWRLGFAIVPREMVRTIQKLQQNFFISSNYFVQKAGIAALENCSEFIDDMKHQYNQRRLFLWEILNELGFNIPTVPQGAFYIFANAKHINSNSYQLAVDILEKTGLAVTPGIDFGSNGEGYLRFSYTTNLERIREGTNRLKKYLESL